MLDLVYRGLCMFAWEYLILTAFLIALLLGNVLGVLAFALPFIIANKLRRRKKEIKEVKVVNNHN